MIRHPQRLMTFAVTAGLSLSILLNAGLAQDSSNVVTGEDTQAVQPDEPVAPKLDGVIATSTNLSAALPASEWARVESSVDRGLQWLASQQAEDGSFPSDDAAQPATIRPG